MSNTKITPQDIITMLPLDKDFKVQLLGRLEAADADVRFNIEEALWEAYDDMFEIIRDKNLQEQMKAAAAGEVDLNPDFYKKALAKTDDDMMKMVYQGSTTNELSSVREKLKYLIK